jgi:drug/metabolite transporter (DMT)-like permease
MIHAERIKSQTTTWPYMVVFVGFFIGSTGPILIRLAQGEGMSSLAIVAGRQIISTLFLTPLVLHRYRHELRQLSRRNLIFAALAGIIMAVRFVIMFEAFNNTSVLITGVFSGSGPLWVALIEVVILKATFNRNIWIGVFLAIVGGVVIAVAGFDGGTSLGNNPALGALYALTGAFLSAFYLNFGRAARGHISFWPYLWLVFGFATVTSIIAMIVTDTPFTGYSPQAYLWLFILTITAQLIAHGAMNFALRYASATFVSIVAQMTTVISAIGAFLVFGELPGPIQILGSLIIILGVSVATIGKSR